MTGRIAIALGDVTGIGAEVTLKAIAAEAKENRGSYLLLGDAGWLERANLQLDTPVVLTPFTSSDEQAQVRVHAPQPALPAELKPGAPEAAHAAISWLREGARLCLTGQVDALITAPVNKESIIRAGYSDFVGQTEFLSDLGRTRETVMMLLGADDRGRWLRVALATTHVPISRVSQSLSQEKILLAIRRAAEACRDLGLPRAKVGVCGLNPHAGEGGKIGTEDQALVAPAVEQALQQDGLDVVGPVPADTLFHFALRGDYDAVVAMYHDQGLVPLKMIAFETGVNWTLGLPFIRTSPDHGTAYDIAGKGMASPSSMIAAIRLAKTLASARGDHRAGE